jgi:hypothetical protein
VWRANCTRVDTTATPQAPAFPFTWLEIQGIDDALIQPYCGHASRQSLEFDSASPSPTPSRPATQTIGRFLLSQRYLSAQDRLRSRGPLGGALSRRSRAVVGV